MIKSKKGAIAFPHARLAALLLILIGLFLLFPLVELVYYFIVGQGDTASCAVALFTGEGTAACSIDEVVIYADRVEIKYEGETDYEKLMEKGSRTTDEMAKETLAKLLQTCLNSGGGYNSRAFKRQDYYDSLRVCMECFHVTIGEGVPDITEFRKYIMETEPKGTFDKTYFDILTGDDDHRREYGETAEKLEDRNVLVSPYIRDLDNPEKYPDLTFTHNEGYTVFFIAFDCHWYYSYITTTKDLGKACEVKVN